MDILSIEFLTALLAIVVIDLVLAGDNAIVIALASRRQFLSRAGKSLAWASIAVAPVCRMFAATSSARAPLLR